MRSSTEALGRLPCSSTRGTTKVNGTSRYHDAEKSRGVYGTTRDHGVSCATYPCGKWNQEAIMERRRGLTTKEMNQHAKFLAAWEAAEFPDIFVYKGKSLNELRPIAERYWEQQQKDRQVALAAK